MNVARHDVDALYRRHAAVVFRRARQLLKSDAEAHEVVQDLFLSLFERPEQFQGRSSVTTWLYSATTHACLNRLRNQHNRQRLLRERVSVHEPAGRPAPDALATLRNALLSLPPPLGELAVYAYFDELSHEEIARLFGCSKRQVAKQLEQIAAWGSEQEEACSGS